MYRQPSMVLWLLRRLGVAADAEQIEESFPLRWLLGSVDFLLRWGVVAVLAWWSLGTQRALSVGVVVVIAGSFVFGLINALTRGRSMKPPQA